MDVKFYIALVFALALDFFDFIIVGLIPVLGDAVDIIGIIVLFPLIGTPALLGAVEFVPIVGDLLPMFTGAVIVSRLGIFPGAKKEKGSEV